MNCIKLYFCVWCRHIDLLDEHDEMLMYFLRDVRLTWAEVFRRGHYLATVHDYIIARYAYQKRSHQNHFLLEFKEILTML